jgi:hypothetical protein
MPYKYYSDILAYRQRPDRKQKDLERSSIKISCGCGGIYTEKSKTKHNRTNKHTSWVKEEQENIDEKWSNIEPLL